MAGAMPLAGCAPAFPPERIARDWPPIGQFAQVDGLKVHYTDEGQGRPVILVHGASGNLRDMTFSLAPEVARGYRAICMDRPGFGYSDRPDGDAWEPAVQARILRGAAMEIGAKRPIILGHSWAGALALAWAMEFPDEIAGAVVVSGATIPWGGALAFYYGLGASPVFGGLVASLVGALAGQERIRDAVELVFRPQTPLPGYIAYVGGPLALRPETVRANAEDLDNLNAVLERMSPRYPGITTPVEVIHGNSDRIVRADVHAVPLTQLLARVNLTLLPGIGHMPHHVSVPEILAAIDRLDAA